MADVVSRLELNFPIEVKDGEDIKEFVAERRLKAGDFKGIKSSELRFDDMLTLISRLYAMPLSVVSKMDASDMVRASSIVNGFLATGPETGEEPSPQ